MEKIPFRPKSPYNVILNWQRRNEPDPLYVIPTSKSAAMQAFSARRRFKKTGYSLVVEMAKLFRQESQQNSAIYRNLMETLSPDDEISLTKAQEKTISALKKEAEKKDWNKYIEMARGEYGYCGPDKFMEKMNEVRESVSEVSEWFSV